MTNKRPKHGQRLDRAQGATMTGEERKAMLTFATLQASMVDAFRDLYPDWQIWMEGTIVSPSGEHFLFDGKPHSTGVQH